MAVDPTLAPPLKPTTPAPPSRWATVAHIISLIANPIVGCLLLFLLLAVLHPAWDTALVWVGTPLVLGSLGLLVVGRWQGWWTDWDMPRLAERQRYLPGVWGSMLISLALAHAATVPRPLAALMLGIAIWLTLAIAISMRWKVSLHVSGMALVAVFAALYWGGWGLWIVGSVPLVVAWARLSLHRHTLAQVLVGALIGALSMGLAWHVPW